MILSKKTLLLLIGIFILLISCSDNKSKNKLQDVLTSIKKHHKLLNITQDSLELKNLELINSTSYPLDNMRYEVYRISRSKKIKILTIEYLDKLVAMPILPLEETSYWKYENEHLKCDTFFTFSAEYKRAINDLGIKDSIHKAYFPYIFIEKNILGLDNISLNDTNIFLQDCDYYGTNEISLKKRNKKNVYDLVSLMHPTEYSYYYFASADFDNKHVLWAQMEYGLDKKVHFIFKSFQFGCPEIPAISL